ncbi:HAD family phosphatase [Luteolibacter sp. LG18]|uniref:HAD family hydrolase n=1 Tax=Luteolibacter sp. LG18 TaxID=2819286 RepID=UPI002B304DF2|nr:hypothetical protein llg_34340 [Luteolibacter sp. LG18]
MNFLYDIGRVLLDFDFESSLARLLPEGIDDPHGRLERLLERKDDFEAGRIPEDEFIAWAIERLETRATPDDFRHAWRNIFTPNEPMWSVVDRLADAGHRLILFSNINSIHCPWIFETYPRFSRFHGAVLSFEVGAIKPEPAIYEHAIQTYGLVPEEVIYIDDMEANVTAGRALGMRTWQYDLRNHEAFESWLNL